MVTWYPGDISKHLTALHYDLPVYIGFLGRPLAAVLACSMYPLQLIPDVRISRKCNSHIGAIAYVHGT